MTNWSSLIHSWFTLDEDTLQALRRLSPILLQAPAKTDEVHWNMLLTIWSAYAKSVHAISGIKLYESWQGETVTYGYEELPKHMVLWGIVDGAQGLMHSALDNLAHAVWLIEYPQKAGNYHPASFRQLFDSQKGLIGANTATKLSPELIHTLKAIDTSGGQRISQLNNASKHKRSVIPRQPIPPALGNNPLVEPLIAQPDSREIPQWVAEIKDMVEHILPPFWQALPLAMRDAGYLSSESE